MQDPRAGSPLPPLSLPVQLAPQFFRLKNLPRTVYIKAKQAEAGATFLSRYVDTRWGSALDLMASCLHNRVVIQVCVFFLELLAPSVSSSESIL